jgi:hypothetical protein
MTLPSPDEVMALARERTPRDLNAMWDRLERTGGCERPIRLRALGAGSPSENGPDGVLLVACKTRRESRCRPCSAIYRGDARQLVRAGIEGGKGVPESVRRHAAVFVTLTAPSFGAVHRAAGGPCHLGPPGTCEHGTPQHCTARHDERDEIVGSPLCADCYDYEAAVVFNATVGELWRRLVIYARRHLAYGLGVPEKELKETVRLSYVKVAELQRRGVVHLHAVVRADAVTDELEPAPFEVTRDALAEAFASAASVVFAKREVAGRSLRVVLGEQLRIDPLDASSVLGIASYLAKYTTKEASGSGALDHRLRHGELEELDLPDHVRRIVEVAWELGGEEGHEGFRRWAHALGFSGHVLTKSRRYSTTFSCLRAERQAWRLATDGETPPAQPAWTWSFMGVGYRKEIDWLFAQSVAEARREERYAKWFELSTMSPLGS